MVVADRLFSGRVVFEGDGVTWLVETIDQRMGAWCDPVHYVKRKDGMYQYQASTRADADTLAAALNLLTPRQWAKALETENVS